MFEIGSYVIYRSEGVCVISDIREESFGSIGAKEKYYILTPKNDEKSTVFVPVNNERLCGMMRKLLSAEEIMGLCDEVRDLRAEWQNDSRVRNTAFRDVLAVGDRRELIILANTIYEHIKETVSSGRKPTATDTNALRRVERMLFDEFKVTTDISSCDDVMPLILGELKLTAK